MSRNAAIAALGIVALAAFLLLFRLGATPLVDPDEGRYAASAAGMLETGDWIVPRFNGEPRLNKPPLIYWLQAVSMAALGRGETAARLPSALAGLVMVVALLWAGVRRGAPGVGLLAALVVATAPLAFGGFHLGVPDAVMATLLALALLLSLEVQEGRLALWPGTVLAATALGLAALTKGHVPLAVFLVIHAGWIAIRGRGGRPALLPLLVGLVIIVVIMAPWVVGVIFRVGFEPLRETLTSEAGRLGSGAAHPEPWHYYLWRYPLVLLPWTGLFLAALGPAWRRRREPGMAFALSWALAPIVLFSLSAGKNNLYLMPALPGEAMLVALVWAGDPLREMLSDRRRLLVVAGITALLIAGGAAFLLGHHSSRPYFSGYRAVTLAVAAVVCAAALLAAWMRRGVALTVGLALFMSALLAVGLVVGPDVIAHGRSTRALAEGFLAHAGPDDDVIFYRAEAGKHPSLVFYLDRKVRTLWRTRELRAARREEGRMYVVTGDDDHARLVRHEIVRWEGPLARARELALYREVEDAGLRGLDGIELKRAE